MSHENNNTLIETLPAIAGLVFSLAAAVQFLDGQLYLGAYDYQFAPAHAFVVSLGSLVVVFASSKQNDWGSLASWEQVLVAVTVSIMTAHQFIPRVATVVNNQNPHAGTGIFLLGVVTWGVISR